MYSLTICFGPAATTWVLLFKEEEKAKALWNLLIQPEDVSVAATDDFGQQVFVHANKVSGMMLEDMELSQQAAIERGLHQARSQAKAQKLAMADPVIASSLRQQQMGPAVLGPGGMMPNGRGMM